MGYCTWTDGNARPGCNHAAPPAAGRKPRLGGVRATTKIVSVPFFCLLVTACLPGLAAVPRVTWASHTITFQLMNRDGAVMGWPSETVDFSTAAHTVKTGDTIPLLLKARRFRPDMESYTLLYMLNSCLQDLGALRPASTLMLPVVKLDRETRRVMNAGFLVAVTVDPELKQGFEEKVSAVLSQLALMRGWPAERFGDSQGASAVRGSLNRLGMTLNSIRLRLIQRNGVPISSAALRQLDDETALLHDILGKALVSGRVEPEAGKPQVLGGSEVAGKYVASGGVQPEVEKPQLPGGGEVGGKALVSGGVLSEEDQIFIGEFANDAAVKQCHYTWLVKGRVPPKYPTVVVTVKTMGQDGKPVYHLRVYYVGMALLGRPDCFIGFPDTTHFPYQCELPEGDYYFWATDDKSPVRLNEPFRQKIRRSEQPVVISLTVR